VDQIWSFLSFRVLNPGTHNLWPFEVFISFVIGGVGAIMGAYIGKAIIKKK